MARAKLDAIKCIDSHSVFPLVAIGTAHGQVHLFDIISAEEINNSAEYHLSQSAIRTVTFISSQNHLVAFDDNGDFFLIEVTFRTPKFQKLENVFKEFFMPIFSNSLDR